jgi:hypothetical protein
MPLHPIYGMLRMISVTCRWMRKHVSSNHLFHTQVTVKTPERYQKLIDWKVFKFTNVSLYNEMNTVNHSLINGNTHTHTADARIENLHLCFRGFSLLGCDVLSLDYL